MKYAVFSTPRTASSLVTCMLANHFQVENLGQLAGHVPANIRKNNKLRSQWLAEQMAKESYSIKLFSSQFAPMYFNKVTFDWTIFEKIIITERINVTDQICSIYYMQPYIQEPFNPFPANTTPIDIDFTNTVWVDYLEALKTWLVLFHNIKNNLLEQYPDKVSVVSTELFTTTPSEFLPTVNSLTGIPFVESDLTPNNSIRLNLNWSEKYTNYNELKEIVDSWELPS
jgi:hypothetical protein